MTEVVETKAVEIPHVEDIVAPITEIKVPAKFLPSEIPAYQRLRDAPYKFKTVIVYFEGWSSRYMDKVALYYLTDEMDCLVRIDEPELVYVTRSHSKAYRIKIFREELPKELKVYAKSIECHIVQWPDDEIIFSIPERNLEVKLRGDIRVLSLQRWHDLFVSLWFRYVVPRLTQPRSEGAAAETTQPKV